MRNSIAGTWFFGLVIVFFVIFIAFFAVTINYHNAVTNKSKVLSAIEQANGFNDDARASIAKILSGYRAKGFCLDKPNHMIYGVNLEGDKPTAGRFVGEAPEGEYSYCIYYDQSRIARKDSALDSDDYAYISVDVFLNFNLPVFGDIVDFRISGTTTRLYKPTVKV